MDSCGQSSGVYVCLTDQFSSYTEAHLHIGLREIY